MLGHVDEAVMVELRAISGRLDYSSIAGTKAGLRVTGDQVVIRLDLPTWEWIELAGKLAEIRAELLSAPDCKLESEECTPLFREI
jgi:hypothetical protein